MTKPSQVPELLASHRDYLQSSEYVDYATAFIQSKAEHSHWAARAVDYQRQLKESKKYRVPTHFDRQHGVKICQAELGILAIAPYYHVSEPMMAVARMAAESMDSDAKWSREHLPSNNGFLVFEQPLRLYDVWNRPTGIKAVSWKRAESPLKGREPLTAFTYYADRNDTEDYYSELLRQELDSRQRRIGRLQICRFAAIQDGEEVGPNEPLSWDSEAIVEYMRTTGTTLAEAMEDFKSYADSDAAPPDPLLVTDVNRIIYTVFALMDQTIASVTEEENHRTAKKFRRHNIHISSKVTVIRLRREAMAGKREEGTGRFLLWRTPTRGHWRRVHYGPDRQEVKRIWIHPYFRNPEGPVNPNPPVRVTTLSR